jgi:hypothetical protein
VCICVHVHVSVSADGCGVYAHKGYIDAVIHHFVAHPLSPDRFQPLNRIPMHVPTCACARVNSCLQCEHYRETILLDTNWEKSHFAFGCYLDQLYTDAKQREVRTGNCGWGDGNRGGG